MRSRLLSTLLSIVAGLAVAAAPAAAGVPQGFVGMNIDGPFYYPYMDRGGEMDQMVASGVQSIRLLFAWSDMQPYKNFAAVPPSQRGGFENVNGVPTSFTLTDQIVGLAAMRRLTVMPILQYAPPWDSLAPRNAGSPPASPGPFARFAGALARRYGKHGTFWAANPSIPRVPIRLWQIWNEPDFNFFWSKQPFEPSYMKLVRATRPALKAADSSAKIVLAGFPNFSWDYLASIYKIHGARGLFDAVAIHPYTATPANALKIVQLVRAVMNRAGDRSKPIFVTELSWPSAKGKARQQFENETNESGQAQKVGDAVRLLAKHRNSLGIGGFYYYDWIGNESKGAGIDPFNYAGLLRFLDGRGTFIKPVFYTFKRASLFIEGCKHKGSVATGCLH